MGIEWTNKQKEAIGETGKNLLVSAAAGSGKTAVLIERIKRLLLDREKAIDIDRFLIVTFTNAAASEMKEKLIKDIYTEIEKSSEDSVFLRRQLDLMANANISTFHSFAINIIREYFHTIDIDPGFKIADSEELEIIKWEAIDELFEKEYASSDESFKRFLDNFSSDRNDTGLKKQLLNLYAEIMNIPEPFDWLRKRTEEVNISAKDFAKSKVIEIITRKCRSAIKNAEKAFRKTLEVAELAGVESIAEKCRSDLEAVSSLREAQSFDEMSEAVNALTYRRLTVIKAEKESWDEVKKDANIFREAGKALIAEIKKKYLAKTVDEYAEEIKATYPDALELEKLIKEFDALYKCKKKNVCVIDFNDVEHYALEILKDDRVCETYRNKFEYVFVDEYQDSNELQDTLINRVGRSDNIFMVGDIKQSIYKFRLAEPEIFRKKYYEYKNDKSGLCKKIDLSENFRSKAPIINAVNAVFSGIMSDYDEDATLKEGVSYTGDFTYDPELWLTDISKNEDMPSDMQELKAAELEANAAAEIIAKLTGTKYCDMKDDKKIKKLRLRDIVILMRSVKGTAEIYQKVLGEHGINTYIDVSGGYFDTVEVELFLNLLRIIDNFRQDIPLISIMKSIIGKFSIDELIKIRLQDKKLPFYENLIRYAAEAPDDRLRDKCAGFIESIDRYRQIARGIPLDDLMWRLMEDTGFYTYVSALPGGRQRRMNLKALVDKALAFQSRSGGGIYEFICFIDSIKTRKIETGQACLLGENDDVVRIMTIHKSKGLEFPAVILAGLGKKLKAHSNPKRGAVIHKDIGIGLTVVNHCEMWFRKTISQILIEDRLWEEELEELIRLLYVAMTRAKDRLVLLGTVENSEKAKEKFDNSISVFKVSNYLDYIGPLSKEAGINTIVRHRTDLSEDNELEENVWTPAEVKTIDQSIHDEVYRRLSFIYPYKGECSMKSKYSVSELNRNRGNEINTVLPSLKIPEFAENEHVIKNNEKGTIMHLVMQHLDFAKMLIAVRSGNGTAIVEKCIKMLIENELLSEDKAEMICADDIAAFFETDLGKRAAAADEEGKLYREREFNMLREIEGAKVMVQGIIDCCFEEEGEYILIDYKTNYVDKSDIMGSLANIRKLYKDQVELYKEAIQSILKKPVKKSYLYLFNINSELEM